MSYDELDSKYKNILSKIVIPEYGIIFGNLEDLLWLKILNNICFTKYGISLHDKYYIY